MITVCAIITILSALALPVARFSFRRQKEIDLHYRLRRITLSDRHLILDAAVDAQVVVVVDRTG